MKKPTKQICYVIISIGLLMFVIDFLILTDILSIKKDLSWIDWLAPSALVVYAISMLRTK
ncbi:MAG: hypothetical protein RR512_00630 [Coprobacillus sp.]